MNTRPNYYCIEKGCKNVALLERSDGMYCSNGHFFTCLSDAKVPVFVSENDNSSEYSLKDAVQIYDNALRWIFETFETDEHALRRNLISRLRLEKGMVVLVTGAGAGNDLPFLAEDLNGIGTIYAQDISKQMLMAAVERHNLKLKDMGIEVFFSISDATNLPFCNDYFDAAYHFGGINLFKDISKGIHEMSRVVRPGGRIVFGDEGVAPWLKNTEFSNMMIRNNSLYMKDPPLTLLPEVACEVKLSWILKNCFYVLEFVVSEKPVSLNIDVPHIGKRGGTIRTRYFGQLEGIDPDLRDRLYAEAEGLGIGRVEYLESILKKSLKSSK